MTDEENNWKEIRLDDLAKSLSDDAFIPLKIKVENPKAVWVAKIEVEVSRLFGKKIIAIVMNASTFEQSSEIDYFLTNADSSIATGEWVVTTYSQRNWVEVFYRKAKGWLGLKEYKVRDYRSLIRHFILVLCAYNFILWHTLTGGLSRRWTNKLWTLLLKL